MLVTKSEKKKTVWVETVNQFQLLIVTSRKTEADILKAKAHAEAHRNSQTPFVIYDVLVWASAWIQQK